MEIELNPNPREPYTMKLRDDFCTGTIDAPYSHLGLSAGIDLSILAKETKNYTETRDDKKARFAYADKMDMYGRALIGMVMKKHFPQAVFIQEFERFAHVDGYIKKTADTDLWDDANVFPVEIKVRDSDIRRSVYLQQKKVDWIMANNCAKGLRTFLWVFWQFSRKLTICDLCKATKTPSEIWDNSIEVDLSTARVIDYEEERLLLDKLIEDKKYGRI